MADEDFSIASTESLTTRGISRTESIWCPRAMTREGTAEPAMASGNHRPPQVDGRFSQDQRQPDGIDGYRQRNEVRGQRNGGTREGTAEPAMASGNHRPPQVDGRFSQDQRQPDEIGGSRAS
ncbi:hypothetical protein U1Q18_040440 [Sarracenia purpurea var. burkii]